MNSTNSRHATAVLVVLMLLCTGLTGTQTASAEDLGGPPAGAPVPVRLDDVPPPPPPPALPTFASADDAPPAAPTAPMEPLAPAAPVDEAVPTAPAGSPCDFPAPAPCGTVASPCAPACGPVCDPCAPKRNATCCLPRDVCGWAIDDCGKRLGRVEVVFEAMYTLYDEMDGQVGLNTGAPALVWDTAGYDGEWGGRFTLRYALTPKDKIEARGSWYGEANGSGTQFGGIGSAPPAGNVLGPTNATLTTRSELLSAETNWWREFCCKGRWRFSGALGMRYIGLEETARGDATIGAAAPVAVYWQSNTNTDFLGAQLGLAAHWTPWKNFELGIIGKGILGQMRRHVDVTDSSVFVGGAHAAASEKKVFGFGAELELSALWRLNRTLALTGGYSALFLNDVVRADDGMDFSQGASGAVQAQQSTSAYLNHTVFAGIQFNL